MIGVEIDFYFLWLKIVDLEQFRLEKKRFLYFNIVLYRQFGAEKDDLENADFEHFWKVFYFSICSISAFVLNRHLF